MITQVVEDRFAMERHAMQMRKYMFTLARSSHESFGWVIPSMNGQRYSRQSRQITYFSLALAEN